MMSIIFITSDVAEWQRGPETLWCKP